MKIEKYNKLNRTFARRIGKNLSENKKAFLEQDLPKVLYTPEKLKNTKFKKTFLEIGYGMGEHFIAQLKANPQYLYIGIEVYLNGVASVLKQLAEYDQKNFMLWPDDLDEILHDIPDNTIDGIFILFPDPWHKKRYLKKRLFNMERFILFKQKLKQKSIIYFASDIIDYFESVKDILTNDQEFKIILDDFSIPHTGYTQTKYHTKAINEGRKVQFISAMYIT